MKYSEIRLLLTTYSHCKNEAENCNECPWVKNKGECNFDEDEWSLKLYEACWELLRTVEDLHANISELQEDNSRLEQTNKELIEENKNLSLDNESYKLKLDISTEMVEDLRGALVAYREVGRDQALAIYRKDVYIAELKAKLEVLSSEEEEEA